MNHTASCNSGTPSNHAIQVCPIPDIRSGLAFRGRVRHSGTENAIKVRGRGTVTNCGLSVKAWNKLVGRAGMGFPNIPMPGMWNRTFYGINRRASIRRYLKLGVALEASWRFVLGASPRLSKGCGRVLRDVIDRVTSQSSNLFDAVVR
jgi:hypothetical protein